MGLRLRGRWCLILLCIIGNALDIVLCNTAASVARACAAVGSRDVVSLDVEGRKLGRDGPISLVQLATADGTAYVVDVVALGAGAFVSGLKEILESERIVKLVFDCRTDCDALLAQFGVRVRGVRDLQLLEVMTRCDDLDKQLSRLSPFLHHANVRGEQAIYKNVHRLSSLAYTMVEFEIVGKWVEAKKATQQQFEDNPSFWMERPLAPEALEYAAQDALLLFELLDAMIVRRELPAEYSVAADSRLETASSLYADLKRSQSQNVDADPKFNHPLLPLFILDTIPRLPMEPPLLVCRGCQREFPEAVFSRKAIRTRNTRCDVCRALDIREKTQRQWL
ncbi:hypothetical protein CTAYLR_000287 [Chrysophaeum taylorii]|uniref:3'-5' exonuclease domain-containing protein n=1 Tax=Chrysophaeum taylorii TaxID=2483200 RepID=A0AAD7UGP3_9STRA|nr:hypothetical protein CTAYLR_000287 [Chrysophaeum taylorii]